MADPALKKLRAQLSFLLLDMYVKCGSFDIPETATHNPWHNVENFIFAAPRKPTDITSTNVLEMTAPIFESSMRFLITIA